MDMNVTHNMSILQVIHWKEEEDKKNTKKKINHT